MRGELHDKSTDILEGVDDMGGEHDIGWFYLSLLPWTRNQGDVFNTRLRSKVTQERAHAG
jgi:hypothetical protein